MSLKQNILLICRKKDADAIVAQFKPYTYNGTITSHLLALEPNDFISDVDRKRGFINRKSIEKKLGSSIKYTEIEEAKSLKNQCNMKHEFTRAEGWYMLCQVKQPNELIKKTRISVSLSTDDGKASIEKLISEQLNLSNFEIKSAQKIIPCRNEIKSSKKIIKYRDEEPQLNFISKIYIVCLK